MNVLEHIKEEHKEVEELFEQGEEKPTLAIVREIGNIILPHHHAEEQVVFPAVKSKTEPKKEVVNALIAEHDIIHAQLNELLKMKQGDELFKAKFGVLKELIEHHVTEEEEVFFKHAEEVYSDAQLEAAAEKFEKAYDAYPANAETKKPAPDKPAVKKPAPKKK